jgi:hypothetical protein
MPPTVPGFVPKWSKNGAPRRIRAVTSFELGSLNDLRHPTAEHSGDGQIGCDAYAGASSTMRPSLQPYLASKSAFTVAAS